MTIRSVDFRFLNSKVLRPLLLLVVVVAWADFALNGFLPVFQAPHWPVPAYWVASRLAIEGKASLIYPDPAVFAREAVRLGTVPDIFEANPPTTILLFLPLAPLSETTGYVIFAIAMLICYILACALLIRALALPTVVALGLWALVPLFHPWRENIDKGQVYCLVLLLLVIAGLLGFTRVEWKRRKVLTPQVASGLAFGFIAVLKLYYATLLILPALLYRRWRIVLGAAVLFATAAAITVLLWGPDMWIMYIGYAITWRERPETGVTAYQTLNSVLTHMLRYDATLNRGPVADIPGLVGPLWWAGAVVILTVTCVTLWLARSSYTGLPSTEYRVPSRRDLLRTPHSALRTRYSVARSLLPLAVMVPVALVLSPAAEDYHFVLTLFPLLVAGKALWENYPAVTLSPHPLRGYPALRSPYHAIAAAVLALSSFLLATSWNFKVPSVGGWHSLLYYPHLYGSLLLWLLIIALMVAGRPSPAGPNEEVMSYELIRGNS